MSEEILNENETVSRNTDVPILDLTHLDPVTGITKDNVSAAASEQGIDTNSNFEVRLPNPSDDGKLVIGDSTFNSLKVTKVYNLNKVTSIGSYGFGISPFSSESGSPLSGKIWIDRCTSIGAGAFSFCPNITEVVLNPNGCTLGESCFSYCSSLKKVYNLNKLTSIGNNVFEACNSLSGKIWIDRCTSLGEAIFSNCSSITEVVLSPNLKTISNGCFQLCSSLTKVYNLNKVTSIGYEAFFGANLSGKIWIDSCTSIDRSAFGGCESITEVVLSPNLKTIPDACFSDCPSLTKVYNLNKVTSLGGYVFMASSSLSGKIWIDSCTSIGEAIFGNCSSITDVVLTQELYDSISGSLYSYAPDSVNWIPV